MRRVLPLLLAGIALAVPARAAAEPTVLLLHPSAFVMGDPSYEDDAATYATGLGFRVRNLDYPLCDVSRALRSTAAAAKLNGPNVYAYGDSAGGTLAARLAERGLVRAAGAFSPVVDVPSFVGQYAGATSCITNTRSQLAAASLETHPSARPILQVSATDDPICPPHPANAWGLSDPLVWTRHTSGGHLAGGQPGTTYEQNMHDTLDWLARRAGLTSVGQ